MKRVIYIILAAVMLFFSACGEGSSAEGGYRYDVLGEEVFTQNGMIGGPIKGGSAIRMNSRKLQGEDYPGGAQSEPLYYLFDEESKLLYPLCYDPTCSHGDSSCFACFFYGMDPHSYWEISKDRVIVINGYAEGKGILHAYVYTLDGVMEDKILFDMNRLVGENGKETDYAVFTHSTCRYGGKVFLDVAGYLSDPDYEENGERFNRWVITFDFDTLEFEVICTYSVPDPYADSIRFADCDGEYFGFTYDSRYAYKVELSTGKYEETDLMELTDRLIESGKLPKGQSVSAHPVSGLVSTYVEDEGWVFFNIETGEQVKLSQGQIYALRDTSNIKVDGKKYYETKSTEETWTFTCFETGEEIVLDLTFEKGKYRVHEFGFGAEKGCVYTYLAKNQTDTSSTYSKTVGGTTVEYVRAEKYVYVSYEDMADGKIDTPLYYDPDTGCFEK